MSLISTAPRFPKCQAFQTEGLSEGQILPTDCQDEILQFAISLIHCPKKTDRLISIDRGCFHQQIDLLEQAHDKMEHLSGVLLFARLSKSHYELFKPQMVSLREEITAVCRGVHRDREGPRFLREIVDTGHYLKVLRIYIQAAPEAIWNEANIKERHEGFGRTLLHNAIAPNCSRTFSKPFAEFLIEIIKKHEMLDILSHKDSRDRTALQHLQRSNVIDPSEITPEKVEIEESLIALIPEPTPPPPTHSIPAPKKLLPSLSPKADARPTATFASSIVIPVSTASQSIAPSRIKIIFFEICSFIGVGLISIFRAVTLPFTYLAECFDSRHTT